MSLSSEEEVLNFFFLFLKFLEDIRPFCEATDTPVLDIWLRLPLKTFLLNVNTLSTQVFSKDFC